MKKCYLVFLVMYIASFSQLLSQKEAYNWICGDSLGLNFNTADKYPVVLKKPINIDYYWNNHDYYYWFSNNATISDSLGNYLFHSYNGISIWNKKNQLIHSYKDIGWDSSKSFYYGGYWGQSNYIVPAPGQPDCYYNFFSRPEKFDYDQTYNNYSRPCYHLIDMKLNGGDGGIKTADIFFHNKPYATVLPVLHENKKDIWIIAFNYANKSDSIYAYLLTDKGLDTAHPVISLVTTQYYYYGCIKLSPDGRRIALRGYDTAVVVLDFNRSTGKLTYSNRSFVLRYNYWSSFEFSPDGSKLYTFNWFPDNKNSHILVLLQFDLNTGNSIVIDTLDGKLHFYLVDGCNSIQLGPGGRVYTLNMEYINDQQTLKYNKSHVGVIRHPNKPGRQCDYKTDYMVIDCNINDKYYYWQKFNSFPNFFHAFFYVEINAFGPSTVCEGDSIFLSTSVKGNSHGKIKYKWTGPKGFSSDIQNPVIPDAVPSMSGAYVASFEDDGNSGTDTVHISVIPRPDIKFTGNTSLCKGDSTLISATSSCKDCSFLWSTGDTTQSVYIKESGTYTVNLVNSNGCVNSDSIKVNFLEMPQVNITGQNEICKGNPVTLSAESNQLDIDYLWSTGETTKEITAAKPGKYEVIVENKNGCRDTASIDIIESPRASIEITGLPCSADNPVLKAKPTGSGYKYSWSSGESSPEINAGKEGTYYLYLESPYGCLDTASIEIYNSPSVSIVGDGFLCKGDEVTLSANSDYKSYLWSTGETTKEIIVRTEGKYTLTAFNDSICPGSAEILVTGHETSLICPDSKDFGLMCSGDMSGRDFIIKNEGADSAHISDIRLKDGTTAFTSPSIKRGSGGVSSGDSLTLNVSFTPQQIGHYKDTIIIECDYPCPKTYKIAVSGTATASTLVSLPDTTVYIKDLISLPLKIEMTCGNALPPDASYEAEIRYDASALLPDVSQDAGVVDNDIVSGDRVISVSGSSDKYLKGTVLLSAHDVTPLRITSFKWSSDLISTEIKNGSLTIKGICRQSLSRVQIFNNSLDMSITPNPAHDEAEIVLEGDAKGSIPVSVYSVEGVKACSLSINKTGNKASATLDLKDFSPGVYEFIARFNGQTISQPVVIVK